MTTFNDRELAIEAHYAALELTAFREHSAAAKQFGLRVAAYLRITGDAAAHFATAFAEKSVVERADMSAFGEAIEAILRQDLEAARQVPAVVAQDTNPLLPFVDRPWVEFVAGQMLLLFSPNSTEPSRAAGTPH
jgi:hypothetical protein